VANHIVTAANLNRRLFVSVAVFLAGAWAGRAESSAVFALSNTQVIESSGITASERRDDVLWTHNDSGDTPRLFAIDTAGHDLGTIPVEPAAAIDWEDICSTTIDGKPCLIIADTGDNQRKRDHATLYIVEEPDLATDQVARVIQALPFTYEDGPQNCEGLAVSPDERVFYLASRGDTDQRKLYELSFTGTVARLVMTLASLPHVTAMDISRDGRYAVLLTQENTALEYRREAGESWPRAFARTPRTLPLPEAVQAEAICYSPDGDALFVTSEGSPCPLWRIEILPESPRP
jgi:hypothetical protein